jgi:hypothetical protein
MGNWKILVRNLVAAVLGVVLAFILIAVAQVISARIHPPPPGLDFRDPVVMAEYIRTVPVGVLIAVLLGYFIGVAGGAWLATRLSASRHKRQGLMVGALFFIASVMNLSSFPHPAWFWVANLGLVPLAAWLGMAFGEPDERPLD